MPEQYAQNATDAHQVGETAAPQPAEAMKNAPPAQGEMDEADMPLPEPEAMIGWSEQPLAPGTLYVVATPIGNLGDLTFRAVSVLKQANWIACEDTRTSGRLLERIGSRSPSLSYHEHNEQPRAQELLERLQRGECGALICDAGTPAISDPGFRLVRACRKNGVPVVTIPGANAAVAALSISGLPTNAFSYHGFLAPKSAARQRFLKENAQAEHTVILYESSHRIAKLADDIVTVLGKERCISIARELTKRHETVLTGTAESIRKQLVGANLKGEFVVSIAPEGFAL